MTERARKSFFSLLAALLLAWAGPAAAAGNAKKSAAPAPKIAVSGRKNSAPALGRPVGLSAPVGIHRAAAPAAKAAKRPLGEGLAQFAKAAQSGVGAANGSSENDLARQQQLYDSSKTGFLADLRLPETLSGRGEFMAPNEQTPAYAAPILRKAGPGAYVSVGTERGFMGAAMTPRASRLLLLDIDGANVKYNRTNIALLKISKHRKDYLHLRLEASPEEWAARSAEARLEPDLRESVSEESFWWWEHAVRSGSNFALFQRPPPKAGDFAYAGANYLHDETLFKKIHALARAGGIKAHQADLAKPRILDRIVGALAASGAGLSVLDLSNAWSPSYIPGEKVAAIVEKFKTTANPAGSLLLLSGGWRGEDSKIRYDARVPRTYSTKPIEAWEYLGFRFRSLGSQKDFREILSRLESSNPFPLPEALWSAALRAKRA